MQKQLRSQVIFVGVSIGLFVLACAAIGFGMIRLVSWYLSHCQTASLACTSADLLISYWGLLFVPAILLAAVLLFRLNQKLFPSQVGRANATGAAPASVGPAINLQWTDPDLQPATPARKIWSHVLLLLVLSISAYLQFSVVSRTLVAAPFRADSREYFFSAYNLTHFGTYSHQITLPVERHPQRPTPDTFISPGYPLFLAMVGDPEPTGAYLRRVTYTQATLGVLSVWLLFLISSRFLPMGWSHAAALLAAVSPHLAVMSTYLLTETVFTLLMFAAILMSLVALHSRRGWQFLVAGLLCGLASLVRPTLQFLPPLIFVATLLVPRLRAQLKPAALVLAGMLLMLTPWMLRQVRMPAPSNQPSLMVSFVLHGSYPGFMYKNNPATYGDPYRLDPYAADARRDLSHTFAYIYQRFRQAPLTYVNWYLIGKPGFFLSWTNIDGAGDIFVYQPLHSPYLDDQGFDRIRQVTFWLHWPLMLLGMAGILLLWWRPGLWGLQGQPLRAARLVSVVVLYVLVFHSIGAPYPRYGIPFRPLLYPLALLALSTPWRLKAANAMPAPGIDNSPPRQD